jgi:hypothetical protein
MTKNPDSALMGESGFLESGILEEKRIMAKVLEAHGDAFRKPIRSLTKEK